VLALPDGFKDTVPYVVLLIMLWIRPQGLFGTLDRKNVSVAGMRFVFKTSYNQDIQLFRNKVDMGWYVRLGLVVLALPFVMSTYYAGETGWVFIYGICGMSLMVLVGYTGLVSLGHATSLGIAAYAHAYFLEHGIPWLPSLVLAVLIATACGLVVGMPALRITGIYLAIAALAFSIILQEVFTRWVSVTHGFKGTPVASPEIFSIAFADQREFYYL
jgi:branched-chain amino acid transport system permease protein